jgi:prepilin-type N-terminal cleavage/methylation domain-containing protein
MKTELDKFQPAGVAGTGSRAGAAGAFTLVELLVVISIIAVLAAFVITGLAGVSKTKSINTAKAELAQIQTALDDYKTQYGSYPPGNPLNYRVVPLYYELLGVTNHAGTYYTLDNASQVLLSDYNSTFDVGGAINCAKAGNDAEAANARGFLRELKANRYAQYTTPGNVTVNLLVTSVPSQDPAYKPLGVTGINPFCYAYPGTNNPNGFDLWVDLKIGSKTNRVSNWRNGAFVL